MTVLKAMAVLAVVLLAGLGSLFVLDLIPKETLQDLSVKSVSLVAILGAASLAIGLLLKAPKN